MSLDDRQPSVNLYFKSRANCYLPIADMRVRGYIHAFIARFTATMTIEIQSRFPMMLIAWLPITCPSKACACYKNRKMNWFPVGRMSVAFPSITFVKSMCGFQPPKLSIAGSERLSSPSHGFTPNHPDRSILLISHSSGRNLSVVAAPMDRLPEGRIPFISSGRSLNFNVQTRAISKWVHDECSLSLD